MGVVDLSTVNECLEGAKRELVKMLRNIGTIDKLAFELMIIILGQYLYCKYYRIGVSYDNGLSYNISPFILKNSFPSKWRQLVADVLRTRNLSCHAHGTRTCIASLNDLYEERKKLVQFLEYVGIKFE